MSLREGKSRRCINFPLIKASLIAGKVECFGGPQDNGLDPDIPLTCGLFLLRAATCNISHHIDPLTNLGFIRCQRIQQQANIDQSSD
jgi:hypothetical protein